MGSWHTSKFSDTLKKEIAQLDSGRLPLQQALTYGNFANSDKLDITILSTAESITDIHITVGIFFTSLLYCCQCSDYPTPMNEYNEYCELMLIINKTTSNTSITLLS